MLEAKNVVKTFDGFRALDGLDIHFASGSRTYMGDECIEDRIRTLEVSGSVSPISAIPQVREAMTAQQRAIGLSADEIGRAHV